MKSYKNILIGEAKSSTALQKVPIIQTTIEKNDDQISKLIEDIKKKHEKKPEIDDINRKIEEAKKMAEQSSQMRKEIIDLKAKLDEMEKAEKKLWFDSRNQRYEYMGQLPGNTQVLFEHAVDLSRGEWGPSQYEKSIEIFEKLLIVPQYQECAAFHLAGMYLKGKVNDLRKDRYDRHHNLSDMKKAELYAGLLKNSAWKSAWDKKKQKHCSRY